MKTINEIKMGVEVLCDTYGTNVNTFLELQMELVDVMLDNQENPNIKEIQSYLNGVTDNIKNILFLRLMNFTISEAYTIEEKISLLNEYKKVFRTNVEEISFCNKLLFKNKLKEKISILTITYGINMDTYEFLQNEVIDFFEENNIEDEDLLKELLKNIENEIFEEVSKLLDKKETIYYLDRKKVILFSLDLFLNDDILSSLNTYYLNFKEEEKNIIDEDFKALNKLFEVYSNEKKRISFLKQFSFISFKKDVSLIDELSNNPKELFELEVYGEDEEEINDDFSLNIETNVLENCEMIIIKKLSNGVWEDMGIFGRNGMTMNDINFLNRYLFENSNYKYIKEESYSFQINEIFYNDNKDLNIEYITTNSNVFLSVSKNIGNENKLVRLLNKNFITKKDLYEIRDLIFNKNSDTISNIKFNGEFSNIHISKQSENGLIDLGLIDGEFLTKRNFETIISELFFEEDYNSNTDLWINTRIR